MVVRVAQRALASQALSVTVAADDPAIVQACQRHGIAALLTRPDHASGSDRLAEACALLGWPDEALVVNLQGDEPLMAPELLQAVAQQLQQHPDCVMSTAAHPLHNAADFLNPNVVKVVLGGRCISAAPRSRIGATGPLHRRPIPPARSSRRHCATSACTATGSVFCAASRCFRRPRWSSARHWSSCACSGTASASRSM